jgi:hypothetical protein
MQTIKKYSIQVIIFIFFFPAWISAQLIEEEQLSFSNGYLPSEMTFQYQTFSDNNNLNFSSNDFGDPDDPNYDGSNPVGFGPIGNVPFVLISCFVLGYIVFKQRQRIVLLKKRK